MADNKAGLIEVQDAVIWPMNIKGNPELRERLMSLGAEEIVALKVDGKVTVWERQRDGKDGRPARGLKPCDGRARDLWRSLYPSRKGDMVSITEVE